MVRQMITVVILLSICLVAAAEIEDAQLRHILDRAIRYEDNPHASWGEVRYAIRCAGGNSNRVVSLMKQLISEGTEDDETTMFYLSEIGKYGTSADLPFLYQRVASTNFCRNATVAILNIEGLTTNSLSQFASLIPDERPGMRKPVQAWCRLLAAAKELPVESAIRAATVSNAVCYALRQTESVELFDGCLIKADSTYRMSKRRLAVLRSVHDIGPNEWQTNFVIRTIRELEHYPEANLSE